MAGHTSPGDRLRAIREELGMSLRDVHRASSAIAKELHNRSFTIPASRLHFYETHDATPSIFRLYTLARLYGHRLNEVLAWYGVPHR